MIEIYNCIQGSDEWHSLRLGMLTASHAQAIATQGKGLETYCRQLAAERFSGIKPDSYKSDAMIAGIEDEPIIRSAYTLETGNEVSEIGFVKFNDYAGCSPDGVVGNKGGVEFKRKTFNKHNDLLLGHEDFESSYIWQCHMNMIILDREWWSLCSYNPLFKNKSLFIKIIERSKEADDKLLAGFDIGEKLIKKYLDMLLN